MKNVSIEQLEADPGLVTGSDEPYAVMNGEERIGIIGIVEAFPISEFVTTDDEEYIDNGGAVDPVRIRAIQDAVDNGYWGG